MGTWDDSPWGSDAAADWFGALMDSTRLREVWHEGISVDPDDDRGEIIYAAAWLFVQLGHVYVWPIETFDEDLERTIQAFRALRADERLSEGDPQAWTTRIDGYITELEQRL